MNKPNITAIAAAIAFAFSTGALAAQNMSTDEYKAGKTKIAAEYKSAKAGCGSLSANAKDVCMAEAKGKQKVAKAELEASSKPSDKNRIAVGIAKAEAEYAVAKEKWGKLTDDQLDVIAGKRDRLAGKIQETYGVSRDDAEKQLSEWQKLLR